ncbi:hypothetical protein [Burkholderia ambifaria]|uniref:hypothetical protein n=1 Tax=Burkholderia ambifaria TaxID=152480 RepID=UPI00158C9386|nr:hypothetical protein [Burkholderia ambifaria]
MSAPDVMRKSHGRLDDASVSPKLADGFPSHASSGSVRVNYYMFPVLMFSQVAKANLTQFPVRPIRRISQDQIFIAKITIWYTHRQALKSRILLPVATPAISTLFRKPAR